MRQCESAASAKSTEYRESSPLAFTTRLKINREIDNELSGDVGEVNEIVERQRERVKCCLDLEDMLENGKSVLEIVPRV